jgi:hypothetical protein
MALLELQRVTIELDCKLVLQMKGIGLVLFGTSKLCCNVRTVLHLRGSSNNNKPKSQQKLQHQYSEEFTKMLLRYNYVEQKQY